MSHAPSGPTALIIGASRGLGFGMAEKYLKQGWRVVGTVRANTLTRLHDLTEQAGGKLEIETVDIVERDQITALRERLAARSFDLLFVNAGVANDPEATIEAVSTEAFVRDMVTNALSPMRVIGALEGLVPPTGTIGVMSSGLGSVADNEYGGMEVYRASKAALNTLMRSFAARHADDPRTLLLIAPGWVRTDMGGPNAVLDIGTSVRGMVDMIAARRGTPGSAYVNYLNQDLPW
jgi:NAD(P)-dependent dehydrogenase (short-subunit alcohol dehydrogenase family)